MGLILILGAYHGPLGARSSSLESFSPGVNALDSRVTGDEHTQARWVSRGEAVESA
jgi:hypothetical protein